MNAVADSLRKIIIEVFPLLSNIDSTDAGLKPSPEKWSKKEILGHLIDSACNNQQKFVRTMAQPHLDFVGYDQNHWVAAQHYQEASWQEIIPIWVGYNLHIAHIIEHVDATLLENTVTINGVGPFTLEFIMKDYIEHLKHHLRQILPEAALESKFENVYGA
jgi:DinB superfamily